MQYINSMWNMLDWMKLNPIACRNLQVRQRFLFIKPEIIVKTLPLIFERWRFRHGDTGRHMRIPPACVTIQFNHYHRNSIASHTKRHIKILRINQQTPANHRSQSSNQPGEHILNVCTVDWDIERVEGKRVEGSEGEGERAYTIIIIFA